MLEKLARRRDGRLGSLPIALDSVRQLSCVRFAAAAFPPRKSQRSFCEKNKTKLILMNLKHVFPRGRGCSSVCSVFFLFVQRAMHTMDDCTCACISPVRTMRPRRLSLSFTTESTMWLSLTCSIVSHFFVVKF